MILYESWESKHGKDSRGAGSITFDRADFKLAEQTFSLVHPQPLFQFKFEDTETLNQALTKLANKMRGGEQSVVVSNIGGWHSTKGLQHRPEKEVKEFLSLISTAMQSVYQQLKQQSDLLAGEDYFALDDEWQVVSWININAKGDYNTTHNHLGTWSGVYYVETGLTDDESGQLVIEDNSGVPINVKNNEAVYRRDIKIKPENGLMVVFPSRLYHRVLPYLGDRERISIAFNIYHPSFAVPNRFEQRELNWRWKYFRGPMEVLKYLKDKARKLINR